MQEKEVSASISHDEGGGLTEEAQGRIGIPIPMGDLYRYKKRVTAPFMELLEDVTNSNFIFEREEHNENGVFVYLKGCLQPFKTFVFPEGVFATNMAKKIVRNMVRFGKREFFPFAVLFALLPKKMQRSIIIQCISFFRESVFATISNYILEPQFYTPLSKEMRKFINNFFSAWGIGQNVSQQGGFMTANLNEESLVDGAAECFVTLIENDNAYRWRIEDIASCSSKEAWLDDPRKEILRLQEIYLSRESNGGRDPNDETAKTFRFVFKILRLALLLPSFRTAFFNAMELADFKNFQMDAPDEYHSMIFSDYNYGGLSVEERNKKFKLLHGVDPDKLDDIEELKGKIPPRLVYTMKRAKSQ